MSDSDEPVDLQDEEFDNNVHQVCYIYKPFTTETINERPSKKRKTNHDPTEGGVRFPHLFQGKESDRLASQRYNQLQELLKQKEKDIDELIGGIDATVTAKLAQFVISPHKSSTDDRLRTGFVVSGPDSSIQNRLQNSWKRLPSDTLSTVLVQLRASSCPNLQTVLKNIIKNAIVEIAGSDGHTTFVAKHKKLIPMNYDLELLQLFVNERGLDKVIVSIVDVETFDTNVLSQLLWSLSSWSQRIPFVALLGIATTVELFETRLPKSTATRLKAEVFQLTSEDDLLYKVYEAAQYGSDATVLFGPLTVSALYEASQSQSTTAEAFKNMIKVAYLSHYFANSLSVLATGIESHKQNTVLLCEALRNTASFRRHCTSLVEGNKKERLQLETLLTNDAQCLKTAITAIVDGQTCATTMFRIIQGLKDLYKALGRKKTSSFLVDMELYDNCEHISSTELFEDLITALKDLSSDRLCTLLSGLLPATLANLDLDDLLNQVRELQSLSSNETIHTNPIPLPSLSAAATRTITSPRKPLSNTNPGKKNNGSAIAKSDQYTVLLNTLSTHLTRIVDSHGFSFNNFMHEAFIINSRQPLLAAFTPRPRHVLERALSKPADYLGCQCDSLTGIDAETYSDCHSSPSVSIVYDLLQEAGTIINIRDLFDAFQSRHNPSPSAHRTHMNGVEENTVVEDNDKEVEDDEDEDEREREEQEGEIGARNIPETSNAKRQQRIALCLFYRSLAELKMLGMVKSSTSTMTKKRALASEEGGSVVGKDKKAYAEIDFIAKTSWAGL